MTGDTPSGFIEESLASTWEQDVDEHDKQNVTGPAPSAWFAKHVYGKPDEEFWAVVMCDESGELVDEACLASSEEMARRIASDMNAVPELLHALNWILTDMTFAAPETFVGRCYRWQEAARAACGRVAGASGEGGGGEA